MMVAALRGVVTSIGGEFVGSSSREDLAKKSLSELKPELLIIDLFLDSGPCYGLLEEIRKEFPRLAILVVTFADELRVGKRVLEAGANGLVMKSESVSVLKSAIAKVLAGRSAISRNLSDYLVNISVGRTTCGNSLSNREEQVYYLVGKGYSTREIAELLHISRKTVESHKEKIKVKLNIADAAHLAVTARDYIKECDEPIFDN